jgi:23S rRNA (guanine2445-N2)-methyltransferase / 23S rRNA (guanine2069-N7)-methyltransferase
MCGSGTLAIEAGLWLKNIAPGLLRETYGFQQWPDYDRALFASCIEKAKAAIRKDVAALIIGIDKDPYVVQIARENVDRAGLSGLVKIERADFFEWDRIPEEAGTLVMNPPYDERLPVDNTAELYQRIGDKLKHAYGGWTASILCGNLDAVKYISLRSSQRTIVYNGSIECRLLQYKMRALDPVAVLTPRTPRNILDNPQWKEKTEIFTNRVRKNFKRLSQWVKREGISCWRVYDRDIPEFAFILDLYGDRLHFAEVERNHDHSPIEHTHYMQGMVKSAAEALGIAPEKTYFKKRKPQKSGGFQYAPHDTSGEFIEVSEGGHRFLVNLADYLDVGLFLDHRNTRKIVEQEVRDKDFLNLFAYTGSFTVYAAAGGAKSTTTVDTSSTYLEWAQNNLRLNGFLNSKQRFIRSDVFEFLERSDGRFDICVVDPPTRSVNRSSARVFDVQEDYIRLLQLVLARMRPEGKVFFSTNYQSFIFKESALTETRKLTIEELTSRTLPLDFQRKTSHRCWTITIEQN